MIALIVAHLLQSDGLSLNTPHTLILESKNLEKLQSQLSPQDQLQNGQFFVDGIIDETGTYVFFPYYRFNLRTQLGSGYAVFEPFRYTKERNPADREEWRTRDPLPTGLSSSWIIGMYPPSHKYAYTEPGRVLFSQNGSTVLEEISPWKARGFSLVGEVPLNSKAVGKIWARNIGDEDLVVPAGTSTLMVVRKREDPMSMGKPFGLPTMKGERDLVVLRAGKVIEHRTWRKGSLLAASGKTGVQICLVKGSRQIEVVSRSNSYKTAPTLGESGRFERAWMLPSSNRVLCYVRYESTAPELWELNLKTRRWTLAARGPIVRAASTSGKWFLLQRGGFSDPAWFVRMTG
jgi:hypothetical protein